MTAAKIRPGAVDFSKLAAGTDLVASATSGPVPISSPSSATVNLQGTTTFATSANTLDLLSVEARGTDLARIGAEECRATVVPYVNGSPIGFTRPGAAQTVSVKVNGDADCPATAAVTVAVAVTRAK